MKKTLNRSIWGKSIAQTVLVIRDEICHSADSVTSLTAGRAYKVWASPSHGFSMGFRGALAVYASQDKDFPVLWQQKSCWCSPTSPSYCFISLTDQIWFCQSLMPNALVCVRGDASQSVPSVPTEMSLTSFVTAGGSSGSEISDIAEAKPHWQGLQETQCYCLTMLVSKIRFKKQSWDRCHQEHTGPWEGVGQLFTECLLFHRKSQGCLWHSAKSWGGSWLWGWDSAGGCNFTPSGQHRTFNLIQGRKDVGFMPLTHGTLKKVSSMQDWGKK